MNRRTFLRGAGFCLALPMLEAMQPALSLAAGGYGGKPRRMVAIETNMGILPQFFFPEKAGQGLRAVSPYLEQLAAHRDQMTVFSGVSHPGRDRRARGREVLPHRHAAPRARRVPQLGLARPVRRRADRQPHALPVARPGHEQRGRQTLSYTRSGAPIPAERSPKKLFQEAVRAGQAGGGRGQRRGASRRAAACSTSSASSRKRLNRTLSPADRQRHGPVLHLRPRTRAAAAQRRGVGAQAQAEGDRQAAGGHRRRPRVRPGRRG